MAVDIGTFGEAMQAGEKYPTQNVPLISFDPFDRLEMKETKIEDNVDNVNGDTGSCLTVRLPFAVLPAPEGKVNKLEVEREGRYRYGHE